MSLRKWIQMAGGGGEFAVYVWHSGPLRSLNSKQSQFGIRITPGRRPLQGPAATHITRRHRWLSTNNESPPPPSCWFHSPFLTTQKHLCTYTQTQHGMREGLSTPWLLWEIDICATVEWEREGTAKQKQCRPSSTIKDRKKKFKYQILPVFCAQLPAMFQNRVMCLLPNGGWICWPQYSSDMMLSTNRNRIMCNCTSVSLTFPTLCHPPFLHSYFIFSFFV